MRGLFRPLQDYLVWATSLRSKGLTAAALILPPFLLVVGLWLLFFNSSGGNDSPDTASAGCSGFSTQGARDYCSGLTSGDVLDCTDFDSQQEATRFVAQADAANQNRLEEASPGTYCPRLAVASPPTRAGTGAASSASSPGSAGATSQAAAGSSPSAPGSTGGSAGGTAPGGTQSGGTSVPTTGPGTPAAPGQPAANTPVPGQPTSTAAPGQPTSTPRPAQATSTSQPGQPTSTPRPGSTPQPTPVPGSQAAFNIVEAQVSPGQKVNYQGSSFTPNDRVTVELFYLDIAVGSTSYQTDAGGSFTGSGQIPAEAADYPGTYTIISTDSHGKSASDSTQIQ